MIVELITDNEYGSNGPRIGTHGAVLGTYKDEVNGEKYYSVAFEGFVSRGFFFAWDSNVKVIKK